MKAYLLAGLVVVAACGGGGEPKGEPAANRAPPPAQPATANTTQTAAAGPASSGPAVFARTCQACHQVNGQGTPRAVPPLAGSQIVAGAKPRLIRIALAGLTGPITVKGQSYNGVMPSWKSLSDADLAAVLTHVRSSFGNSASAVTAAEVAAERTALAGRTTPLTAADIE